MKHPLALAAEVKIQNSRMPISNASDGFRHLRAVGVEHALDVVLLVHRLEEEAVELCQREGGEGSVNQRLRSHVDISRFHHVRFIPKISRLPAMVTHLHPTLLGSGTSPAVRGNTSKDHEPCIPEPKASGQGLTVARYLHSVEKL
jgi:hypothetical protein